MGLTWILQVRVKLKIMSESIKRRSVIGQTLVLAGAFLGGLLDYPVDYPVDYPGRKSFTPTGPGSSMRGPTPAFYARRGKHKGFMRSEEYQKKHQR